MSQDNTSAGGMRVAAAAAVGPASGREVEQ